MENDLTEAAKAESKRTTIAQKTARTADKQRLLRQRHRQRRREQLVAASLNWRKHVARLKGQVKQLLGAGT